MDAGIENDNARKLSDIWRTLETSHEAGLFDFGEGKRLAAEGGACYFGFISLLRLAGWLAAGKD